MKPTPLIVICLHLSAIIGVTRLEAQNLVVHRNQKSGRAQFFKPTPAFAVAVAREARGPAVPAPGAGAARPRGNGDGQSPAAAAMLAEARLPLGASVLKLERQEKDPLGMTHLRYAQTLRGVRVYGADAILSLDAAGKPSSLGANLSESPEVNTTARLTPPEAIRLAEGFWKAEFKNVGYEIPSAPTLYVLDTSLIANTPTAEGTRHLVYAVRIMGSVPGTSWMYFVSASDGMLVRKEALEYGQAAFTPVFRRVSDCDYSPGSDVCGSFVENPNDGFNYVWGRKEDVLIPTGPNPRYLPEVSTDTDEVFDIMGHLHKYVQTTFGLDGANRRGGLGAGPNIAGAQPYTLTRAQTYVDSAPSWLGACPSARFSTAGIIQFCKGTISFDVVGHEYAHGIQHFSHWEGETPVGMVYAGETAGLMENHSVVIGEAFEHSLNGNCDWVNGSGANVAHFSFADPPSVRFRNSFGADRRFSPHYYCGGDEWTATYDNMQIFSKAFYLTSAGGWFNGCTVGDGIGIEKAVQIWNRAMITYFSRTETFSGAFFKFQQASSDLYGPDSRETAQLRRALLAVELDQPGRCSAQPAAVPPAVDVAGW